MIANALKKSSGINYPGLIAAWSAKGKTNDDEDRDILRDLTGNGHDITLNGFAFSEMSGYGGYDNIISNGTVNSTYCDKINNVEITVKQTHPSGVSTLAFNKPSTNKAIYEIKGLVDGQVIHFGNDGSREKILSVSKDGIYEVNWNDLYNINSTYYRCIYLDYNGDINCTIKNLPLYDGALVFDGVDDYISLDAFDSGFKTVFMVMKTLAPENTNKNEKYYHQEGGTNVWGWNKKLAYQYDESITLINGIKNTTLTKNQLALKKHLVVNYKDIEVKQLIPKIGGDPSIYMFGNMALYKFLGFKEALTEEQIKAITKKYNLLDGVDEIEVS